MGRFLERTWWVFLIAAFLVIVNMAGATCSRKAEASDACVSACHPYRVRHCSMKDDRFVVCHGPKGLVELDDAGAP